MRNHLKIIWLIGLIALTIPALLGYMSVSGAVDWTVNDTANHLSSKSINNSDCNACHWKIVDGGSGTGAGGAMNAHKTHVVTAFLNFASNYTVSGQPATDVSYGCAWCHQQTVMTKAYEGDVSVNNIPDTTVATTLVSGTGARKQVSSDLCERCHGSFRTNATVDDATITAHVGAETNCSSTCHDDDLSSGSGADVAISHGASSSGTLEPVGSTTATGVGPWWIDQRYANSRSFCLKCHGGLPWFDNAVQETNPANP